MKYLTLLLFALLVFACGDATDSTTETDLPTVEESTEMEMETPAAPAMPAPELQSTIEAVQSAGGDITALPAGAAVSNIDTWIGKLSSMDGTDGIVSDLESLKGELGAGSINGERVGELLDNLSDQTRSLGGGNAMLNTLADALEAGAEKLGE